MRSSAVDAASEKGLPLSTAAEREATVPLQRSEKQQPWARTDDIGMEQHQNTSSVTGASSSDRIFPTSESPAEEKGFASQQYEQSVPWRAPTGAPEDASLTHGALGGTQEAPLIDPQGPPTSMEAWAISRAAAAAAAAGLPHLLIGVVLADGSVWGIDDLRGEMLQALQYSSLLQQSLAMSELQQQQLLLDQQQLLQFQQLQRQQLQQQQLQQLQQLQQQQMQQPPSPSMLQQQLQQDGGAWNDLYSGVPRRLQQQATAGARLPPMNAGLSQPAPVGLGATGMRIDPTLFFAQQLQQKLQQQLPQQQLPQQQQSPQQLPPTHQQRCPAGSSADSSGVCSVGAGEGTAAADHHVLPILNWRLSRQVVSYQVSVATPDGGFEEVEVTPEEMSRLLQGAQLLLEFDSASEHNGKAHASVNNHPIFSSDGVSEANTSGSFKDGRRDGQEPKETDYTGSVQQPQPSLAMAIPLPEQRNAPFLTGNSAGASLVGGLTGNLTPKPTGPQSNPSLNDYFASPAAGREGGMANTPPPSAPLGASPTASSIGSPSTNNSPGIQRSNGLSDVLPPGSTSGRGDPVARPNPPSATNPTLGNIPSNPLLGVANSNSSVGGPSPDTSPSSLGASPRTPVVGSRAAGTSQTPLATRPPLLPNDAATSADLLQGGLQANNGAGALGPLGTAGGSMAFWLAIAQGLAREQLLQQQAENLLLQQYGINPQ